MDASKIQTKSFPEMLVVSRKVYLSMSWVALRIDLACLHRGIRQLHIDKDAQTQNMSTGTLYTAKLPRSASTIIITFKKWTVMESSDLKVRHYPLHHWPIEVSSSVFRKLLNSWVSSGDKQEIVHGFCLILFIFLSSCPMVWNENYYHPESI